MVELNKPNFTETYKREVRIFSIINKIESRGLQFDYKKAGRKNLVIKRTMKELLPEMDGINPNSPAQVIKHLQLLGVPDKLLLKKGKITTEGKTLLRALLSIKSKKTVNFVNTLLEYRSYKKISGTYLGPLSKRAALNNGIVHCSINPTDARTGRMTSVDPNLFNIPETKVRSTGKTNSVRECFICRPGFANYYFDYKQMEMGLFGLLAGDDRIINGYQSGEDLHDYMAKIIWPQYDEEPKFWRDVTKSVNFGCIFGMGIRTMALLYQMKEPDARKYYNIYMEEFPSIREFQEECRQRLELDGCVWDGFGRRYSIPVGESYKAVNSLVQGSCAQIFKIALLAVDKFISTSKVGNHHILLPVYDEIQIESDIYKYGIKKEAEFCKRIIDKMTDIPKLKEKEFKLKVAVKKTVTHWADKKEIII